ncbi:tRNA (uracil(54)-C(5))-methyltransferase homolog-B-like [Tetranychus urticae]|uniref:tRNA (uracil(54)-C(5))-methyltransferase homolog-B-like n=1 Tax=Tetranychus urticae TaxID=32264 RepID=UPI00077BA84A|nr:tRNA (uracil(54)-C(5))-methyltransferase homolog-B-like [Tetranychus urticae]
MSHRTQSSKLINYGLHAINSQVAPLVNLSYEAQLSKKQSIIKSILAVVGKKLASVNSELKLRPDGLPCELEEIRAAPLITGYRNKDEFSIWPGDDGKTPLVGFLSNSLSKSTTHCIEPDLSISTKDSHKKLAKKFQEYIQSVSPLGICTYFDKPTGNWRRLIVRSNQENQLMATCVLHPKILTPNELKIEKSRLLDFFKPVADELSLSSLYFQACPKERCSSVIAPFQLLLGNETICETLLGYKFHVSPDSFFQVNTSGTEVLYNSLFEKLKIDKDTVVIDLNCEIGTAIIPIASRVKKIYGIDPSLSTIDRAYRNAQENGISNCQFFQGYILDVLPELFKKLISEKNVVVITKPKRGGLKNSILNLLREFEPVKQIAYLSSKPDSINAISNFVYLSKAFRPADNVLGGHFNPITAIPVDLFPQTNHQELIFIFERIEIFLFK